MCGALYTRGCGGWVLFAGGGATFVALCMLEAVECGLCLLVPEVMRCVLLYMLEAVEREFCLSKVLEMVEVMRCTVVHKNETISNCFQNKQCWRGRVNEKR
jgi:hypothetical protein